MSKSRKILIVSGTRADYGLLKSTIREVHQHPNLTLQLVVTGSHLSPQHNTVTEIENDGFPIHARIPILDEGNDQHAVSVATSKLISGLSDLVKSDRPDIMLLLGDRYEMFGAATVGILHNLPMAHIHGGELTFGAVDDALRHSITKMSWWHFTSAEEYRKRVIQLGESPERVFNVGAPALDGLDYTISKEDIEEFIGLKLVPPVFLVTLHPETQSPGSAKEYTEILLKSIQGANPGTIVFTKANADAEGEIINNSIANFLNENKLQNSVLVSSLGQLRYLSLLKMADVAIGNSSSLVIEAPMLKTPSINIGSRQMGRVKCNSVQDVDFDLREISSAIEKSLSLDYITKLIGTSHPFGEKGVGKRIVKIISESEIPKKLIKGFYE